MFDVYTKEIELEIMGKKAIYKLKPLSGQYFAKLVSIATKLDGLEDDMSRLDESTVKDLHLLVFETLRTSYPEQDPKQLELFTSQNFMKFLPAVLEANMGKDAGIKQS